MKRYSFVRGMLPYIGKECSGQGVFRAKRCLKTVSPCGVAGGDFFYGVLRLRGKLQKAWGGIKRSRDFFIAVRENLCYNNLL